MKKIVRGIIVFMDKLFFVVVFPIALLIFLLSELLNGIHDWIFYDEDGKKWRG